MWVCLCCRIEECGFIELWRLKSVCDGGNIFWATFIGGAEYVIENGEKILGLNKKLKIHIFFDLFMEKNVFFFWLVQIWKNNNISSKLILSTITWLKKSWITRLIKTLLMSVVIIKIESAYNWKFYTYKHIDPLMNIVY